MKDIASPLDNVPNISADMLEAYSIAADGVFGRRMRLNQPKSDTSHVERHSLTIRMGNCRYTRKTNAYSYSGKRERHVAMMNLFAVHYTFVRIHQTPRVTPAMEAGIDDRLRDLEWIVGLIDADTPPTKKPSPKPGTKYRKRMK